MRQTTRTGRKSSEKIVKDIKRATRKQYSSEEKIRIVLDGLRGEDSIAELCPREGMATPDQSLVNCSMLNVGSKTLFAQLYQHEVEMINQYGPECLTPRSVTVQFSR